MIIFVHKLALKTLTLRQYWDASIIVVWDETSFKFLKHRWDPEYSRCVSVTSLISNFTDLNGRYAFLPSYPINELISRIFEYHEHISFEDAKKIGEAIGVIQHHISNHG